MDVRESGGRYDFQQNGLPFSHLLFISPRHFGKYFIGLKLWLKFLLNIS